MYSYIYVYTHMYVDTYICVYVSIHISIYIYICVCTYVYTYRYIYIYTHKYIQFQSSFWMQANYTGLSAVRIAFGCRRDAPDFLESLSLLAGGYNRSWMMWEALMMVKKVPRIVVFLENNEYVVPASLISNWHRRRFIIWFGPIANRLRTRGRRLHSFSSLV